MAVKFMINWIKRYIWVLIIGYSAAIFILSSMPQPPVPPEPAIPYQDKFLHIIEYFIYALLWQVGLLTLKNEKIKYYAIPISIMVAILYGVTDEIHQSFVPTRVCNLGDVFANSIGAAISGLTRVKI